jgi:putative PIN family toxin of toxin-antitoxin system
VSAFAFGGRPYQAISRLLVDTAIWVSPDLLSEYRQVPVELEHSEKISRQQTKSLLAGIAAFVAEATVCNPRKRVIVCRDPEDNMLLECCLAAAADLLVTGDRDLLDIPRNALTAGGLRKLRILRPGQYLR